MPKSTGKRQIDKVEIEPKIKRRRAPGRSIESRENQLVSLAVDLAERQIRNGTASSQVITHFLKLGTTREQLEKSKLDKENKLLEAKTKALQSQEKIEELYENALAAMRKYGGHGEKSDD